MKKSELNIRPQTQLEFNKLAQLLKCPYTREDLIVSESLNQKLDDIISEIKLQDSWGIKKKIKPGYRALFYGSSGTGKTLTATLIGKYTGRDVYRIDLSLIISKYIGETEKNLAKVFDMADYRNWILFFDEADALFGKRTEIKDSHDRYANQEVAYLLQRIEEYPGLIILAANFRSNIDEAFVRRIRFVMHFPKPDTRERERIWGKYLSEIKSEDQKAILVRHIKELSSQADLTGAQIKNSVLRAQLVAMHENKLLNKKHLLFAINDELLKEKVSK